MRKDIQALRAIAVVSVLVFHLWPNLLPGGFVGVDIFFVISGYLIVGHLTREALETKTLSLKRFYARRAIRLLPLALLVLAATAIGVMLFAPSIYLDGWLSQIVASVFYFENWQLAISATDYLHSTDTVSPVQHYWSLSVEEQFYILTPILMLVALKFAKRLKLNIKSSLLWSIGLIGLASLGYSIWLTGENQPLAYFSTFTRTWELAIGAILAIALPARSILPRTLRAIALALMLVSFFIIDTSSAFPGYLALLPVLGASLWISANPSQDRLINKSLAPIGDISYAIYLWHWPLVALVPMALGHELSDKVKVLIIALSLGLAWVSTNVIERFIRFNPKLAGFRKPKAVMAWATAAMLLVAFVPTLTNVAIQTLNPKPQVVITATLEECLGAKSLQLDPAACEGHALNSLMLPSLDKLSADNANRPECWAGAKVSKMVTCTLGPEKGYSKRILAIGDSHAASWIDALEKMAVANNWRIDFTAKAGCYWTTAKLWNRTAVEMQKCDDWRKHILPTMKKIKDLDAIFVTHASKSEKIEQTASFRAEKIRGQIDAWAKRPDLNVPVIALRDNPISDPDLVICLNKFGLDANDHCSRLQADALFDDGLAEAANQGKNVHLVDLTPWYCPNHICTPVIGHVVVYRDTQSHLTTSYTMTLTDQLQQQFKLALGLD